MDKSSSEVSIESIDFNKNTRTRSRPGTVIHKKSTSNKSRSKSARSRKRTRTRRSISLSVRNHQPVTLHLNDPRKNYKALTNILFATPPPSKTLGVEQLQNPSNSSLTNIPPTLDIPTPEEWVHNENLPIQSGTFLPDRLPQFPRVQVTHQLEKVQVRRELELSRKASEPIGSDLTQWVTRWCEKNIPKIFIEMLRDGKFDQVFAPAPPGQTSASEEEEDALDLIRNDPEVIKYLLNTSEESFKSGMERGYHSEVPKYNLCNSI